MTTLCARHLTLFLPWEFINCLNHCHCEDCEGCLTWKICTSLLHRLYPSQGCPIKHSELLLCLAVHQPVKFQRMCNLLVIQNMPYMRCKIQLFIMEQCSGGYNVFFILYTLYFNTFFWNVLPPHMKQAMHSIPLHRPTCFLILIA